MNWLLHHSQNAEWQHQQLGGMISERHFWLWHSARTVDVVFFFFTPNEHFFFSVHRFWSNIGVYTLNAKDTWHSPLLSSLLQKKMCHFQSHSRQQFLQSQSLTVFFDFCAFMQIFLALEWRSQLSRLAKPQMTGTLARR